MNKWIFVLIIGLIVQTSFASQIQGARVWASEQRTRVVFDLSDEQSFESFTLEQPDRVVIDIQDSQWASNSSNLNLDRTGIKAIRKSSKSNGVLRVVLDLNEVFKPNIFMLKPQGEYGHRLVVDLDKPATARRYDKVNAQQRALPSLKTRDFIIAIDAGHGGEDPGAIGRKYKTREKDIVLSVGKKLERLINRETGMHAFMVRTGDYYVGLRKRMQIARQNGADLFISLHADSFKNTKAQGASVYILSGSGASNEAARWLAERENRADLVGGISLDDKGDILASVLLDLSQTANLSASEEVGQILLDSLGQMAKLHQTKVQRAGFAVLKSPDVPSVLVELGFISNAQGESNLRNAHYQQKLANALLNGVKSHFATKPRPIVYKNPGLDLDSYVVKRGDTLSHIAQRLNISVQSLRLANQLKNDNIKIGQILTLPQNQS